MSICSFSVVIRANEAGNILSNRIPWDKVENPPEDVVEAHQKFIDALENLNKILKTYGTKIYM